MPVECGSVLDEKMGDAKDVNAVVWCYLFMVVTNNVLIIRKNYVNYVEVGGGTDANCKIMSGSPLLLTRSALYLPVYQIDQQY